MSDTPRTDEQCCEASAEELCKAALKHYDYVSTKALEWSNQIPQAIHFWYLEKPRLERELAAARQSAPAAETLDVPVDDVSEIVKWVLHYYGYQPTDMTTEQVWLYKLAYHINAAKEEGK